MEYSVETEKRDRMNDRKMARIIAISAAVLLLTILSFIGYRISNPNLQNQLVQTNEELIPLDPQILEQGLKNGGAGSPAKANKTEMTPAQMEQILTEQSSSTHAKSGNSNITNTVTPTNNPSGAKHVSDNPFATGGINGTKYHGSTTEAVRDEQDGDPKSAEKVKRQLIEFPNTHNIASDENCKIVLSVLVDPDGNIVGSPTLVKSGSTTNDMAMINQVISAVKNQAKFNKANTTKNTKELIVIRVNAN